MRRVAWEQKVRLDGFFFFFWCKVPVFRSTICLSAGFSLFNQSNMKQEIWSLPRDVHPSEASGKWLLSFLERLCRLRLRQPPIFSSEGIFWDFEASWLKKKQKHTGVQNRVIITGMTVGPICVPPQHVFQCFVVLVSGSVLLWPVLPAFQTTSPPLSPPGSCLGYPSLWN